MEKPAYQILVEFWSAIDADINFGPTSPEAIFDLEEKYSIKLPPSFREYLLGACPIGEDQWDPEVTTWWNIDRIKSLEEELDGTDFFKNDPAFVGELGHYIVFADHMMWSWAWAICCKPGKNYGRILQLYETGEFVSNRFDDFVQAYVKFYEKGLPLPSIE